MRSKIDNDKLPISRLLSKLTINNGSYPFLLLLGLLISSQKLNELIKDRDDVIVIDARSFSEYKDGHIPGALNIDLFQLHWFDTSKRGIKDFNRQTRILLSNIGIRRESQVIFYDDVSGIYAARGVWLLLYFSQDRKSVV